MRWPFGAFGENLAAILLIAFVSVTSFSNAFFDMSVVATRTVCKALVFELVRWSEGVRLMLKSVPTIAWRHCDIYTVEPLPGLKMEALFRDARLQHFFFALLYVIPVRAGTVGQID